MTGFLGGLLRRKLFLAIVAGGATFASVYAFAASLNVSSNTLGAGNAVVASCIPTTNTPPNNQVTVSYGTTYDSTIPGYRVSSVTLTAPSLAACANKAETDDLTGAANASLGQVNTTVPASPGTTLTIAVPATGAPFPVSAANVTGVSVVIAG
jgi:hypothetical protein